MYFFIIVFLLGIVIPFLFIKAKSRSAKWIPTSIFLIGTIIMTVKAWIFPGTGMADLGDVVYGMILGLATIGTMIGAVIIKFWKK
ncbi:MAG: hypothetical protein K6T88_20010 [Bacillus sp. (in: Bacteria)]|nr:hypothetical protein [Bacillus sp. (in: firmicutes)]